MKNFTTLNEPSDLLSGADGDLISAPMQVSLAPDSVSAVSMGSVGRPNRMFALQQAETVQLAPTALQEAIMPNKIPPPEKKAPLPKPPAKALEKGSDEEEGDEAFTEEEGSDDSDGKILGMPKGIAIGIGVAIVAIGGFLIYKKVKG